MIELHVLTSKDGLLSPLAHDLKIRATKLELAGSVLTIDAASLRVASAGGPLPTHFYGEIEKNIREDVLRSARFPTIRFEASAQTDTEIVGQLTLCGVTREIRCKRTGNVVEYELDQRDFGIKPYTAMLGTLKVKPIVRVSAFVSPPA